MLTFAGVAGGAMRPCGAMQRQCKVLGKVAPVSPVRKRPATVRMLVLDSNTILAVVTALVGLGGGIGLVAWTENQGLRTEQRVNDQPCFDCKGAKEVACAICKGTGQDPVFKSKDEPCSFCEGEGMVMCDNCAGSGIQPRFLDRLSPDDFMD